MYPNRLKINASVQNLSKLVLDPKLKEGTPEYSGSMLVSYNGGFSVVYPITVNNKKYALRCWVKDIGKSEERFEAIGKYLKQINSKYFADFEYLKEGIIIEGKKWAIVRMDWVDGIELKKYIKKHLYDAQILEQLASDFLEMVIFLHQNDIAHGDLQHGNILVLPSGELVLVDYDSMYVPALSNFQDNVKGFPDYQHPKRDDNKFVNPHIDYFSELVIFLGIKIFAAKPDFWEDYKIALKENQLFFSQEDYQNLSTSQQFKASFGISDEIDLMLQALEKFCEASDILSLQPLEKALSFFSPEIEFFEFERIGEESFLSWKVKNSDTITLDGQEGIAPENKINISDLTVTKTFKLIATKEGEEPAIGEVKVKVPKIITFDSSEYHVYDGKKMMIFWEVEDANQIKISGLGDRTKSPKGQGEIIAEKNKRIELIVKGDTKTITKSIPLHFVSVPQINWIPIPQPSFSELTINFDSKISELGFNISFQNFYHDLKESSLRMREMMTVMRNKNPNSNITKDSEVEPSKNCFFSLKETVLDLKEKIYKEIKNKYNH